MSASSRRRQALLSTVALVGSLTGYMRAAYAACPAAGGVCTDANLTTQTVNAPNATVTTDNTFSVDTTVAGGNALVISGAGAISYTDDNESDLTAPGAGDTALIVTATGDIVSGNDGSIDIDTNGDLTGGLDGIYARNDGSGDISVTAKGNVEGTIGLGIYARNFSTGQDVTVTTEETVTGGFDGIRTRNYGQGNTTITANGDVTSTGTSSFAINARAGATSNNLSVTTEATVTGDNTGIYARNNGTGATDIKVYGQVYGGTGSGTFGVDVYNLNNASSTLSVATGASSTVKGAALGVRAVNFGTGALTVTANGYVQGTTTGLIANQFNGAGDLTVETGANSEIIGLSTNGSGIRALSGNSFTGDMRITTHGTVTSAGDGIYARNDGAGDTIITTHGKVSGGSCGIDTDHRAGGDVNITTFDTVTGDDIGIRGINNGSGKMRIAVNDKVTSTATGAGGGAIVAFNDSGSGTDVRVGSGASVTGGTYGIYGTSINGADLNITIAEGGNVASSGNAFGNAAIKLFETGATHITVAGTVQGATAGAIVFDTARATNDSLELQPGFEITTNGNAGARDTVLAGPGEDTLAFGGKGSEDFNLNKIGSQFRDFELFQVEGGSWSFSGSTNEAFTQTGGVLEGTGTFGGLTVIDGTLAPGNSIGTMKVNGAFTLGSGAIYEVEANAAGKADKVIVKGTVNITGATLKVLAAKGNYKLSTDYIIVDNDGKDSVKGTFKKVTSNLAFLTPSVDYKGGDGNDVVLTLERDETLFPDVAKTKNQRAVAGALSQLPTNNPLYRAVLNQTASGARQAFDALSGDVHPTVTGTLVTDSRYAREAVLGRMMQAGHQGSALSSGGPQTAYGAPSQSDGIMRLGSDPSLYDSKHLLDEPAPVAQPLAFWTEAFGAWGDFRGGLNAAHADRDLGGFISGMDASIGGTWRAGLASGASFSDVSVDRRNASANVETYHLGGYVNGAVAGFALRGGGLWSWNEIETSRAVVFPGFFERQRASYDADTGQLFGEIAYPAHMLGLELEPYAGLAYVSVKTHGFKERGGPQASLRGVDLSQNVGYSTLGLRTAFTMKLGGMALTPHIEAAWLYAFGDVTPAASLAFATTGIGFDVDGVPLAKNSALIDAGLNVAMSDRLTASLSYSGQYALRATDNAVKGRLTWLFN